MLPASRAACVPVCSWRRRRQGLGKRRRIIGAVAAHCHKLALALLVADELELVLGGGLGKEVIDTGFRRDCGSRSSGCRR